MTQIQAIEIVQNVENSNDLLLCGIDGVEKASIELSSSIYYKVITNNNTVKNIFGLGEDSKFFYSLLSYRENSIIRHESGFGYAYEKDNQVFFHRELPLYRGKELNHKQLIEKNLKYECLTDCTNILVSNLPDNYILSYYDKNCILVSKDSLHPRALKVKENSFLARVNDNDVNNLDFNSKDFSDIIGEAICKYSKQLSLKTSKLNASKLAVKQLQLESNNGSGAKAGTFIYDGDTDTVKFYNGTRWRTLKWADEENQE